jgi:hypothetical protein
MLAIFQRIRVLPGHGEHVQSGGLCSNSALFGVQIFCNAAPRCNGFRSGSSAFTVFITCVAAHRFGTRPFESEDSGRNNLYVAAVMMGSKYPRTRPSILIAIDDALTDRRARMRSKRGYRCASSEGWGRRNQLLQ